MALDGEREGAEEVVEEVGILEQLMEDASVQLSRAPSLAESLAPSLASFKNVTEAVAAATIQYLTPEAEVTDEVIETKPSVAASSAAAAQDALPASVPASRSRSSGKNSKLSNVSSMDDHSVASRQSLQSRASSKGGRRIGNQQVTVVPVYSSEDAQDDISAASRQSLQSKASSNGGRLLIGNQEVIVVVNQPGGDNAQDDISVASRTSLQSKASSNGGRLHNGNQEVVVVPVYSSEGDTAQDNTYTVVSPQSLQRAQIIARMNFDEFHEVLVVPVYAATTPASFSPENVLDADAISTTPATVRRGDQFEKSASAPRSPWSKMKEKTKKVCFTKKPTGKKTKKNKERIFTKLSKLKKKKSPRDTKSPVKEVSEPKSSPVDAVMTPEDDTSAKTEDVVEVQTEEEKKESADNVQMVMNTSMVGSESKPTVSDVVKQGGFDCAMWNLSGWFNDPTKAKEEVAAETAALISAIKARWLPASEEPKPSLNEVTAADISQAVELLNAQRTLVADTEVAITRAEETIQEAEDMKQFQEAEADKARLEREVSDGKRMEEAAKELVHHLFNSLTNNDRLEAVRLSGDIAQAEKEVRSTETEVDFGCFQLDPYLCTIKDKYGEFFEKRSDTDIAANSSSKVFNTSSKASIEPMPRSESDISKAFSKASSKSAIEEEVGQ